jgi:ABC-type sugar transport system substrate-binding protein
MSLESDRFNRRRFMSRSAVTGAGLVAGGGLLAACGSSGSSTSTSGASSNGAKKLTGPIAYHQPLTAWVIGDQIQAGITQAAKQVGVDMKVVGFNGDSDKELAQIDQMGALGIKAANTVILDTGLIRQLVVAAKRNNLRYSSIATMGAWVVPADPQVDFFYQGMVYPPDGAYATCKNMFKALNGKGTFAHLSGSAGVATSPAKDRAVDRALKEFPNIELVGREYGEYNREKSHTALNNILAKTGGKVDAVFCQSDDEGTGALDSLREHKLLGKTLVGAADGIPEFIDAIIEGTAFGTEAVPGYFAGGYTIVQALDAAAGHKPRATESLMWADMLIIDNKESAQAFKDSVLTKGALDSTFDFSKTSRVLHPDDWTPGYRIRTFDADKYWGEAMGVKKPSGYSLPQNYVDARAKGEPKEVDADYEKRMGTFPLGDVAKVSRTGKTLFEQLDEAGGQ